MSKLLTFVSQKTVLFLFCITAVCSFSQAQSTKHIDFVLDLDGVLIDGWKESSVAGNRDMLIETNGAKYRLADGAGDFLQSLLNIPNGRISFFSAGTEDRNVEVLKKIVLPNGMTAFEIAQGRVFSRSHLSGAAKDISIVAEDIDLNYAILIDDQNGNALKTQKRNLLWLMDVNLGSFYGVYSEGDFHQQMALLRDVNDPDLVIELKQSFLRDRNKLARARGIVELVLQKASQEKINLADALNLIQYTADDYNSKLIYDLNVYRLGIRKMKEANPKYKSTSTAIRNKCAEIFITIGR